MSVPETNFNKIDQSEERQQMTVTAQTDRNKNTLPKGRPPGSKNKPKQNPKPRKPYTSTKRTKCVAKEDLLERLKREVTEQALAVVSCDQFEAWLAAYATHEGNDYVRKDQHEHTYNSTHHRVVTYGCNHTETRPIFKGEDLFSSTTTANDGTDDAVHHEDENKVEKDGETEKEADFETIGCDAILDIYYFYESSVYQIIQLGEHEHEPSNIPQMLYGAIPGIGDEYHP